MTTLGFVGLGHMGGNMAARFLDAGYTVFGESRDRGDADDLVLEGLQWRGTPREIAEAADVLITSIPNDDVLDSIASGPDGILADLTEGKVWVDMIAWALGYERPRHRGALRGAWAAGRRLSSTRSLTDKPCPACRERRIEPPHIRGALEASAADRPRCDSRRQRLSRCWPAHSKTRAGRTCALSPLATASRTHSSRRLRPSASRMCGGGAAVE